MRRVNAVLSKVSTEALLPLDLEDIQLQRRVGSSTTLNRLFMMWALAAAAHFEEQTGRQIMRAQFEYRLDDFPLVARYIELPKPPLVTVDSITYASDGSPSVGTFTDFTVRTASGDHCAPGRLVLNDGASWPTPAHIEGGVVITFTAGYATTVEDVPALIRSALLFLVGHFHKYGEEVVGGAEANPLQKLPLGASTLIEAFKYSALSAQAPWEVPWLV